MIVLDTDCWTLLQLARGQEFDTLDRRIQASGEAPAITIVSVQEQIRGRLARLSGNTPEADLIRNYYNLHRLVERLRDREVLDFDLAAASMFRSLKSRHIRIGTLDLRIAALALSRDALLVSRNVRDFRKVPGLRVEDWTR